MYTVGGWAKGDSVPLTSGTGRRFGLLLRFYYTDGTDSDVTAIFNPDCVSQNDWPSLALLAGGRKAYTTLLIPLLDH